MGSNICYDNIKILRYSTINGPGTVLAASQNKIKIGQFCSIAPGVKIFESNHKYDRISSYYVLRNICKKEKKEDNFSNGSIIIEDDVWIGANSVILSGIKIGRGSIVGAGSIVTKNIEPYSIVGGNPAKLIKKRFKDETIEILEEIKWWEWDIEKIRKNEKIFFYTEKELLKNKQKILDIEK